MRVNQNSKKFLYPTFEGYRITKLILWNESEKHFKLVKIFGKKITSFSNGEIRYDQFENYKFYDRLLQDQIWKVYIIGYINLSHNEQCEIEEFGHSWFPERVKKGGMRITQCQDGQKKEKILRSCMVQSKEEQVKKARIIHWNCRTLRNLRGKQYDKINLIKQANPLVCSFNEPNGSIKYINGYKVYEAEPKKTKRYGQIKYNAALLVSKQCDSQLVRKEIDYVSIIIKAPRQIGGDILIASVYVNPNESRQFLLSKLRLIQQDIVWVEQMKNVKRTIIMGDFNLDICQMKKIIAAEQELQLIGKLHMMETQPTQQHMNHQIKCRQIDHVLTSEKYSKYQIIKIDKRLSDHDMMIVEIDYTPIAKQIIVPSRQFQKQFYNQMYEARLRSNAYLFALQQIKLQRVKILQIEDLKSKQINKQNMRQIMQKNYLQKYKGKINAELDKIAEMRFSQYQKIAFKKLRQLTKYNSSKKQGGLVEKAYYGSKMIYGQELQTRIAQDFQRINGGFNVFEHKQWEEFPKLLTDQEIIEAAERVNTNKAIGNDCFPGALLKVRNSNGQLQKWKVKQLRNFLDPLYWRQQNANCRLNLESRVIAINKCYPSIGQIHQTDPQQLRASQLNLFKAYA